MITFDEALAIAKKYDPSQPRDRRTGQWSDRLGLAGRIPLDEGSTFLGSKKIAGRDENDIRLAAVRRGNGQTELRLDVGWDDPERTGELPAREDYDDGEDEGESDYQRALAEHGARWRAGPEAMTSRVDLGHVIDELKSVEELRRMVSQESAELGEEIWPGGTSEHPEGVSWPRGAKGWQYASPEVEMQWKSRMDRALELTEGGDIYSGIIEGEWADIHWQVVGRDAEGTPGAGDWAATRLLTRPHADRDATYSDLYDQDDGQPNEVLLDARASAKLIKELERMRAAAAAED